MMNYYRGVNDHGTIYAGEVGCGQTYEILQHNNGGTMVFVNEHFTTVVEPEHKEIANHFGIAV